MPLGWIRPNSPFMHAIQSQLNEQRILRELEGFWHFLIGRQLAHFLDHGFLPVFNLTLSLFKGEQRNFGFTRKSLSVFGSGCLLGLVASDRRALCFPKVSTLALAASHRKTLALRCI